jgi:fimbrial chaperone protein
MKAQLNKFVCLAYLCLTLWSSIGFAGAINISPVIISFENNQKSTTVTLSNGANEVFNGKVMVKGWQHSSQGDSKYFPTSDIMVSPQAFSIPVNQSQLIRIGIMKPLDPAVEHTYRLIIKQIAATNIKNNAVRLQYQFLLPIYIAPKQVYHDLKWRLIKINKQTIKVELNNNGNSHIAIHSIKLGDPITHRAISGLKQINDAVFAKETKDMIVKLNEPLVDKKIFLEADTSAGKISEIEDIN